jgi:hypothetical protein
MAHAQPHEPNLVVLVRLPPAAGGWPAAEERAVAELTAEGFKVVGVESSVPDLPLLASEHGALAAVMLRRESGRNEVATRLTLTVFDRVTMKTVDRSLDAAEERGSWTSQQAGILAVELLYASLLEIQATSAPHGDIEVPPSIESAVVQKLVRPASEEGEPVRFGVRVGATAGFSGDVPPLIGPELSVFVYPTAFIGAGITLAVTQALGTVEASSGDSDVIASVAVGYLSHRLALTEALMAEGRLGAGMLGIRARGRAYDGYAARTDTGLIPLAMASLGLGAFFTETMALRLDASLSWTVKEVVLDFAGEEQHGLGQPLVLGTLSGEWLK